MKTTIRSFTIIVAVILTTFFFAASVGAQDKNAIESFTQGVEAGSKGNFKEAGKLFKKSLTADPFFTPPAHLLHISEDVIGEKLSAKTAAQIFTGVKLSSPETIESAIKEFNKAIKVAPKYSNAYTLRGIAHALNNDMEKATSDLTNSISLRANNVMAYYTRGSIYASKGIYKHALSDLNKAIELAPKMVAAYNNRAGLYYGKGEIDLAIADLSRAIVIAPDSPRLFQSRGFLYVIRLKDNVKGCADWKKACELGDCGSYNMAKEKSICK